MYELLRLVTLCKNREQQIIVPINGNGIPEFSAVVDTPEVCGSRSLARAALKKAVVDARKNGKVVKLGVIDI